MLTNMQNAEQVFFLGMIHFPLKKYEELERNLRQIIHESSMNSPCSLSAFKNFITLIVKSSGIIVDPS